MGTLVDSKCRAGGLGFEAADATNRVQPENTLRIKAWPLVGDDGSLQHEMIQKASQDFIGVPRIGVRGGSVPCTSPQH